MPAEKKANKVFDVELPWSNGCLSAKMWQRGRQVMVSVPELDICCYGKSQSEAVLRLFTNLLKYHNELKGCKKELSPRQTEHFNLLKQWVHAVEQKMTAGSVVGMIR